MVRYARQTVFMMTVTACHSQSRIARVNGIFSVFHNFHEKTPRAVAALCGSIQQTGKFFFLVPDTDRYNVESSSRLHVPSQV